MKELRNSIFRKGYVPAKCMELLGASIGEDSIEFINVGAMNYVYKATTLKGIIYFKQALKEAKNSAKIGSDLASIPHLRIQYEKNVIDAIKDVMPEEIQLPQILFYDAENNILIMSDVSGGGPLLQDALLEGDFNERTATNIGRFLGISHRQTYNQNNVIRGDTKEDKSNWEVFLNMRTKGIGQGKIERGVSEELSRLYHDVLKNHTYDVLINMDCCPKNIFQRPDSSVGLIDFELASGVGDPAYDIGFALGHYFLFSVLKDVPETSLKCPSKMVDAYLGELGDLEFKGLMGRIIKYAGAVMLYRVTGSSPASFIPKEKYEELISKGSRIIMSGLNKIEEVSGLLK